MDYFGKMLNFAMLWCPNHLTRRHSWGIIGKIISVAFIWYLVVLCMTVSLVTIASLKSGLILSSLKMLISFLSNKAVLASIHLLIGHFTYFRAMSDYSLYKKTQLLGESNLYPVSVLLFSRIPVRKICNAALKCK